MDWREDVYIYGCKHFYRPIVKSPEEPVVYEVVPYNFRLMGPVKGEYYPWHSYVVIPQGKMHV